MPQSRLLVGRPTDSGDPVHPQAYRSSVTSCNQLFTHCNRAWTEIASILAFGVDRSVSQGTTALEDPTISTRVSRLRRRRSSGQGLVEFAIVGGLLFFLIFSVMNAGFYLYGANAMQYAADIGVATIAAEGNYSNNSIPAPNNSDTVAIARMDSDGLQNTPLVKVTQVDIYKETVTNGVFSDATGCAAGVCENQYTSNG